MAGRIAIVAWVRKDSCNYIRNCIRTSMVFVFDSDSKGMMDSEDMPWKRTSEGRMTELVSVIDFVVDIDVDAENENEADVGDVAVAASCVASNVVSAVAEVGEVCLVSIDLMLPRMTI